MSYTDILKKHFENNPNVMVKELSTSFKIPDWEKIQLREQTSKMKEELEAKGNQGIVLVKSLGNPYCYGRKKNF